MEKGNYKKWLTIWNIFAMFIVFLGFGMIHGSPKVERMGSLMIGFGSFYLIMVVARSIGEKKSAKDQQPPQE